MFQLSRDEQVSIAIGLLIVSVVAISLFVFKSQRSAEGVKVDVAQSNIPAPAPSNQKEIDYPPKIYVHVTGEVRRQNVYVVWKGTRLFEVLAQAGLTEDSDPNQLNLAELVHDGQRIEVPRKGEIPKQEQKTTPNTAVASFININTASQQELETLPGIGPVYASRIIEYRSVSPFKKKEDMMKIKGIGEKTFDKLKDRISVE